MSTINWKRQQEEHHMRPLSSHSRGQNKAGRHGWQTLGSMLEDKWAAEIKRQEQLLHTCVWKGQSNFPWRSSSPNITMPLSQCRHVPNTYSTSCQMDTAELVLGDEFLQGKLLCPWRNSSPNIAMPLSRCRHVPNTFSTSCQTDTAKLDFCWTQSKPVTPASRQQWLASGPIMDPMGCEMTSSSQRHTFYHMTR